ncbi:MAG: 50S ribosomal protein L4 [Ignavibacteria bacterium]|nr:50S ribosomal protein L4 [Ignavibacteria bacterium]
MLVNVLNIKGQNTSQIELPDDVFGIQPHEHAMHLAVRVYLSNQRQGTHKTKTRTEVSGGGKKPWKQKGRGTARAGSTRSPVWVGGGTVHGPKPHLYKLDLPKKVRRLARKSAFSLRLQENNLIVVEDLAFHEIKTKQMSDIVKSLNLINDKTLFLIPESEKNIVLSSRNLPKLTTSVADKVSTYDILKHKKLLVSKSSVEKIVNTFLN